MKKVILFALTVFSFLCVDAQVGSFSLSYPISIPMSDLKSYSSQTSFRGISMEYNRKINSQFSAGIETGWNVFYDHIAEAEYKDGTATISGSQYRYTNAIPVMPGLKYYPLKGSKLVKPYVGLGVGTLYINRSTDFGLYRITTNAWQFCIRPEAGAEFKTASGIKPFAGVKYYSAFNDKDLARQSFLSVNIGVRFRAF